LPVTFTARIFHGRDKSGRRIWLCLKPALVSQIEFTEWTPDGRLNIQVCRAER
jgi:hypothetical protein